MHGIPCSFAVISCQRAASALGLLGQLVAQGLGQFGRRFYDAHLLAQREHRHLQAILGQAIDPALQPDLQGDGLGLAVGPLVHRPGLGIVGMGPDLV